MVNKTLKIFVGLCFFIVLAWFVVTTRVSRAPVVQPCTQGWFLYLGSQYFDISDGEGHGPDLGSSERLRLCSCTLRSMLSRPERQDDGAPILALHSTALAGCHDIAAVAAVERIIVYR
jgi:hypothetical protein